MSIEKTPSDFNQSQYNWDPARELLPKHDEHGQPHIIATEVSLPLRLQPSASREEALQHAIMLRKGMVALMGAYDANARIDNLTEVVDEVKKQKETLPSASILGILATKAGIKYSRRTSGDYRPRRAHFHLP